MARFFEFRPLDSTVIGGQRDADIIAEWMHAVTPGTGIRFVPIRATAEGGYVFGCASRSRRPIDPVIPALRAHPALAHVVISDAAATSDGPFVRA